MKYEVTYKITIEVDADNEEEAHMKANDEMDELIKSAEEDTLYIGCEIYKYPREIRQL